MEIQAYEVAARYRRGEINSQQLRGISVAVNNMAAGYKQTPEGAANVAAWQRNATKPLLTLAALKTVAQVYAKSI